MYCITKTCVMLANYYGTLDELDITICSKQDVRHHENYLKLFKNLLLL